MGWPRRPPSNPVLLPRVTAICDPQQPGWPAGATAPSTPQARGGGIALLSASCDWGLRRVPATQRPTRGHTPAGPTLHVDPVTATCDAMPPRARHPLAVSVTARSPPMATTGLARAWLEQHPRGEGIVLSQQSKDLIERCLPLEQSRRPLARMSVRPPSPQPPPPPPGYDPWLSRPPASGAAALPPPGVARGPTMRAPSGPPLRVGQARLASGSRLVVQATPPDAAPSDGVPVHIPSVGLPRTDAR